MENIKEKIIERLLKLGLTKNEAKAYVALLELEVASPSRSQSTRKSPYPEYTSCSPASPRKDS